VSDEERFPVHVHHAAEAVRMRVRRQFTWAGRPDVGKQMPAAGCGPGKTRVRQHVQRAVGRRGGRYPGKQSLAYREPVVQQRDIARRCQHSAEPAAHRGDRVGQGGRLGVPGRLQQASDVDEVAEHLAVVRRRPLVVTAVGQHLHGKLAVQAARAPG